MTTVFSKDRAQLGKLLTRLHGRPFLHSQRDPRLKSLRVSARSRKCSQSYVDEVKRIYAEGMNKFSHQDQGSKRERYNSKQIRMATRKWCETCEPKALRQIEGILVEHFLTEADNALRQVSELSLSVVTVNRDDWDAAERLITAAISNVLMLGYFASAMKSQGTISKIIDANIDHDCIGYLTLVMNVLGGGIPTIDFFKSQIPFCKNHLIPFVRQVLQANLCIGKADFLHQNQPVHPILIPSLVTLANRFDYQLREVDNSFSFEKNPGVIGIAIDPTLSCSVNAPSIALTIYNLAKNALKEARTNEKPIGILVSARELRECVEISIIDSGVGFSYDKMCEAFTEVAQRRKAHKQRLDLIDRCLLSESAREHVPPVALAQKLCGRGESLSGGTGIGLSLATEILAAHDGFIRPFNHPRHGAGVQLLLPNIQSVNSRQRTAVVTSALTRQLLSAMPRGK